MPERWRYVRSKLKPGARLKDAFPDIEKTVIARTFRAKTGASVGDVPIRVDPTHFQTTGGTMGASLDKGDILIDPAGLELKYPGGSKYLGLVHELAHLLQISAGQYGDYDFNERRWEEHLHEADAIHWSGMQAARMGYSREDFQKFVATRYDSPWYHQERIVEAGLGPLARRPARADVHVRRHVRRRRR